MTILVLTTDKNGKPTYSIAPSAQIKAATLTTGTIDSFVVPAAFSYYELHFAISPGSQVFVTFDGTDPAWPETSFSDATSIFNPAARTVPGGTTVKCITPDSSAYISVEMYAINN